MNEVSNQHHRTFEQIRQRTQEGGEFWSARDLMPILEYSRWDKFKAVVHRAIEACEQSGMDPAKPVIAYGQTYFALQTRRQELADDSAFQQLDEDKKRLYLHTELAANLFRATQTEDKLRRENIKGKRQANQTHREAGAKVRRTIKDLGDAMPENLPTPKTSVKLPENKNQYRVSETVRVWG